MLSLLLLLTLGQEFIPYLGSPSGNYLSPDLIAYWKFEETSGAVTDSSGNGRTLAETGTVTQGTGIVGSARRFAGTDGIANYLSKASDSGLTLMSSPFTIACWVYFNPRSLEPNDMSIIGKGAYGGTDFSWWLWLDHGVTDDTLYFSFSTDGTYAWPDATKEITFPFVGEIGSGYNFIVIRWDGATLKLSDTWYGDSVLATETTKAFVGPFWNNPTSAVVVGANLGSAVHHLGGDLDEMGFWKRYLDDCELEWLFTQKLGTFSFSNFDSLTCVAP